MPGRQGHPGLCWHPGALRFASLRSLILHRGEHQYTPAAGVIAAGPLFAGLAAMTAGAAAGGLAGALIGIGIPEAEAKFYAQEIAEKDAILVSVEATESERDLIREIMTKRLPGILANA